LTENPLAQQASHPEKLSISALLGLAPTCGPAPIAIFLERRSRSVSSTERSLPIVKERCRLPGLHIAASRVTTARNVQKKKISITSQSTRLCAHKTKITNYCFRNDALSCRNRASRKMR